MTLVATDAVVLHAFDYLETSRIFRLATRDAGIQSVMARSARTSRRRFGMALDLFAGGVAQLQVREGRELQQLVSFDLVDARHGLSLDLERFAAASAIAELALRFASGEEGGSFFDVLAASLDAVARAPSGGATDEGLGAAWRLVVALGFAPTLESCAVCHEALPPGEGDVAFSHAAGGTACARCAATIPRGRTLPDSARRALRDWMAEASVSRDAAVGEMIPLDAATRRAHLRLLREFLERHLADGRELRAFETWERGIVPGRGGTDR